jgi:uracil-DNA glycosylase family 4
MGFFGHEVEEKRPVNKNSIALLHQAQCQACYLNKQPGFIPKHPHMEPTGSTEPLVYMLGEAPGEQEDQKGIQFVGKAGRRLRPLIPRDMEQAIRWNNCVRTRPKDNETPQLNAIECCRPSVAGDIEKTKPEAIFGLGAIPLNWATGMTGITNWRGRRVPVKIGSHTCWFYPMFHPSYIERIQHQYGNDDTFAFNLDLERAFADVKHGLPKPLVDTHEQALEGVETYFGGQRDLDDVIDFLRSLDDEQIAGMDFETNRSRPYFTGAKILSAAFATADRAVAFAMDHPQAEWTEKQRAVLDTEFKDMLLHSPCRKISHSLSFEQEWSAYFYGRKVVRAQPWGDTLSQAFVLDERNWGKPGCLSLEFLCLQHFGINIKKLSKVDRTKLEETDLDRVLPYNAVDARYHRKLFLTQETRLYHEELTHVAEEHMSRTPTMVLTQLEGIPVDQKEVKRLIVEFQDICDDIEDDILDLPIVKRFEEETGNYFRTTALEDITYIVKKFLKVDVTSVDEETLKTIDHDICRLLISWRKNYKVLSTYLTPVSVEKLDKDGYWVPNVDKDGKPLHHIFPDGKMHPITATAKTRTSRTSSEDTNYQNWPRRQAEGKKIRKVVRPGGRLKVVSADYGQIQARNVAMESRDKALIKVFTDRIDMHRDWTERIARKWPKWIKEGGKELARDPKLFKAYRDRTKNEFVFASFFGATGASSAKRLGIPQRCGEELHDEFWDEFPGVRQWQIDLMKFYKREGYVTGLSGYRRRAPVSENELINTPIQADEAIIVTNAMTRLSKIGFQPSMEIHDDLSWMMDERDIEKNLQDYIIPTMIDCPFKWAKIVPITIEISIGDNWLEKKEFNKAFSSDDWAGDIHAATNANELLGTWDDGDGWYNEEHYVYPTATRGDRREAEARREAERR